MIRPMFPGSLDREAESRLGLTLVEVMVSLGVFTMILLASGMTLVHGMKHQEDSSQTYRAMNGLCDLLAEIQETANLPGSVSSQQGIGAIYDRYHGQAFPVPDLPSGQILVTCFADEATLPAALGGPHDLDFDGDAGDNLVFASSELKLVPMTLTLTFVQAGASQAMTIHRLVTRTTD